MTTTPQTDRPRALHLLEAADFLRDAHFRDGLSMQEAITALRLMADEADPMVGSLARDGLGLDEIAAMPVVPSAPADRSGLRERIIEALYEVRRPGLGAMTEAEAVAYMADAVLAVLPSDGRATYRLVADAIERMQGYPHLILPEEIVAALRLLATGAQPEPGSPAYTRRLAAGERDEQQAQQDGAETRDALMAAHAALAAHAGRQQAVLTRIGQMADHWEQQLPEVIRTPAVVSAIRAALERADTPAAAPATGQPPADTGEEADPLRMSDEPCPGFPDRCPNLRTVEPEPGVHLGGVRCGCADGEARP